jgi:hypothetical protein
LQTSIFIGAHRPDHVPQLFEEAISGIEDIEIIKSIYYRIRETIMVVWPFVGIPWCVPAGLGLVSVLQKKGIEDIGALTYRSVYTCATLLVKEILIHCLIGNHSVAKIITRKAGKSI